MEDATAIMLHTALEHLDERNPYIRLLLINNSSAFDTILLGKLTKIEHLSV